MHRTCDHRTKDLFDPWAFLGDKRRRLLEQSWASVFRKHLLERLPVGSPAPHFSQDSGRPTKDLYVVMGTLILQQMHNLTDSAAVEALALNISWHYALDIRDESDAYVCEKTLRNYRRLVVEHELDVLLFEGMTDELLKAFDVDAGQQRLDSTSIRSAMRSLTRLGVVVEVVSKFLRELARVHPELHASVDSEVIRRYVDREGDGCFADTTPSVSKRRLPEAANDLLNLALMFEGGEAAKLPSFALLQRVLQEQFEVLPPDDDQDEQRVRIKEPREIPCDNVRNPADPDSTDNAHRGQGYLTQVMETYQEDDDTGSPIEPKPDLITHVAAGKMTKHDGHHLTTALDDVTRRQAHPEQVLADSHYGSNENMELASKRNVELISPAMTAKGSKRNQRTLEDFELNADGLVATCPAGHAPISATSATMYLQARFDAEICSGCTLRDRCPTHTPSSHGEGRRFQYSYQRVEQRERRLHERSDAFKQRYRWRAGLEATISRLKHQLGLAHLRVRGMSSVTYTVILRALGLNIRRCAPFMATQSRFDVACARKPNKTAPAPGRMHARPPTERPPASDVDCPDVVPIAAPSRFLPARRLSVIPRGVFDLL